MDNADNFYPYAEDWSRAYSELHTIAGISSDEGFNRCYLIVCIMNGLAGSEEAE